MTLRIRLSAADEIRLSLMQCIKEGLVVDSGVRVRGKSSRRRLTKWETAPVAHSDPIGSVRYHALNRELCEDVMIAADTLDEITAGTRAVLGKVERRHAVVVHHIASEIAGAIADERERQEPDMDDVISRQSAMLNELIAWLERNEVDTHALRDY